MSFWECQKCGGIPGVTHCCRDKNYVASKVKTPSIVAWVRRHPDGALTAEYIEHGSIEQARMKSGAWVPMITFAQAEAYANARIQELLHEESKPNNIKRAEYYGEGYADGWAAGLKKALAAVESCRTTGTLRNGMVDQCSEAISSVIQTTEKQPSLPDEAMAGEQEFD